MSFTTYYRGSCSMSDGGCTTYVTPGAPVEALCFAARFDGPYAKGRIAEMSDLGVVGRKWSRLEAYACAALSRALGGK